MDSTTVIKVLNDARDNLSAFKYIDTKDEDTRVIKLARNLLLLLETLNLSQTLFADCPYYSNIRAHLNMVVAELDLQTVDLEAQLAKLSIQEQMAVESGVCLLITRLRTLLDLKGSEFFFDEMRHTF